MSQREGEPSTSAQPSGQDQVEQQNVPIQQWTSHDAARFSLNTTERNPWKTCLDKSKVYDKGQIELWKDEVDKILLFAALFSAIVTAFTIESSKLLEVDHQASAAAILYAIHQQLDSIRVARQNVTTLPSLLPDPASTFQAPPYAVSINTSWFLSLVLSLTTAALGIFCLQWLREHQKEPSGSAEDVLPLLVLRTHRMDQWGVPSVVGILPVLLLFSLCLFLAGLSFLLVQFGQLLNILVSRVVWVVYLIFCLLTFLPVMFPDSALRTPQAWFFWVSFRRPLERFTSGTALERGWLALGQRLSSPISYATRRFGALEDWTPRDRRNLKQSRDFGFQWLAAAFAHDGDVVQALVECVETHIRQSQANGTEEDIKEDIKVRMEEMMSLEGGRPVEIDTHASLVQLPPGFCYDVAMAYCIDYATRKHPSLIPTLVVRRIELQLRILNTSFSIPPILSSQLTGVIQPAIDNFKSGYYEHLKSNLILPGDFRDQVRETVWTGFSTKSHLFNNCLHLLPILLQSPEPDTSLNQRLQQALNSSPPEDKKSQIRMIVAYICKFLSCTSPTPPNQGDRNEKLVEPAASIACLAHDLLAQVNDYPDSH